MLLVRLSPDSMNRLRSHALWVEFYPHSRHSSLTSVNSDSFPARQQRIKTDMGEYYIDLVFYNYILKCLLLIDLKGSQISYEDVGQMDMYIRMYDDLKCTEGYNPTIGLLLCSETSKDLARYSILKDSKQLYAAKYLTYLPSKEELTAEIERQKRYLPFKPAKSRLALHFCIIRIFMVAIVEMRIFLARLSLGYRILLYLCIWQHSIRY